MLPEVALITAQHTASTCLIATAGVCRPMALMLLCEFILNSTRAPPGEEFLYHTLLELHLMGDEEDQGSQSAGSATAESAAQGVSASSQQISDASSAQVGSEHHTKP